MDKFHSSTPVILLILLFIRLHHLVVADVADVADAAAAAASVTNVTAATAVTAAGTAIADRRIRTAISTGDAGNNYLNYPDAIGGDHHQQHLIIMLHWFAASKMVITRDANGRVEGVSGPGGLTLQHLAKSLHFTFEFANDDHFPAFMEDQGPHKPGMINYFLNSGSDILMGEFGYTANRNKLMDHVLPTRITSMALLIPKPSMQKKHYALAIINPFQIQVWLLVLISLVVGVASLYFIWRAVSYIQIISRYSHQHKNDADANSLKKDTQNNEKAMMVMGESTRFRKALSFIFGLIVVQGSFAGGALGSNNTNRKLAIRFLTGAWCLTCFVLVTAYSSVLVSFMTAPESYKPIINSIHDLPAKQHHVKVTVDKNLFADQIFQSAVGDDKPAGILKYVGEELKHNPEQRCTLTEKCLDQVRQGSSVYIYPDQLILNSIGEDWQRTGRCDFTLAKERFLMVLGTGFLLKKNSLYTEYFNREMLRLREVGFIDVWLKQTIADPTYCLRKVDQEINNKKNDDDKKPLTLKGLSGAFIILGSGYSIAIAVFIVELVHHHHKKQAVIKNQPAADDVVPTSVDAAVISHDERKHVVTLIAAAFVLVDIESDSDDNEKRSPMDTIIAAVDVHS